MVRLVRNVQPVLGHDVNGCAERLVQMMLQLLDRQLLDCTSPHRQDDVHPVRAIIEDRHAANRRQDVRKRQNRSQHTPHSHLAAPLVPLVVLVGVSFAIGVFLIEASLNSNLPEVHCMIASARAMNLSCSTLGMSFQRTFHPQTRT